MLRSGLGLLRPTTRAMMPSRAAVMSVRGVSSVKASHDQEQEILVAQRRNRPISPHLTIYQPQLTWVLSSFHRITGVAMAGGFYALTCGYAASSILGLGLDSAALVSAFTALPLGVQFFAKAVMSYPFVFHAFNGIRHLIWDTGRELNMKGVYRTGYVVLGLTATLGSYLIFY